MLCSIHFLYCSSEVFPIWCSCKLKCNYYYSWRAIKDNYVYSSKLRQKTGKKCVKKHFITLRLSLCWKRIVVLNTEDAALTYLILVWCLNEMFFPIPSYFGYVCIHTCREIVLLHLISICVVLFDLHRMYISLCTIIVYNWRQLHWLYIVETLMLKSCIYDYCIEILWYMIFIFIFS